MYCINSSNGGAVIKPVHMEVNMWTRLWVVRQLLHAEVTEPGNKPDPCSTSFCSLSLALFLFHLDTGLVDHRLIEWQFTNPSFSTPLHHRTLAWCQCERCQWHLSPYHLSTPCKLSQSLTNSSGEGHMGGDIGELWPNHCQSDLQSVGVKTQSFLFHLCNLWYTVQH